MSRSTRLFGVAIAVMIVAIIAGLFIRNPRAAVAKDAEPTQKASATPAYLLPESDGSGQSGLGAQAPQVDYTEAQQKVIRSFFYDHMDTVKSFQAHCGNATDTYVAQVGQWYGGTILDYYDGPKRPIDVVIDGTHFNNVSVIIKRRDDLPKLQGDLYSMERLHTRYAMQVYLFAPGSVERAPLDPARAVVLLGCRP